MAPTKATAAREVMIRRDMGFLRSNHLPGEIVDLARTPTEPDRKSSSIDLDQMEFHSQLNTGDLFA
jgi:hypothetical protein